MNDRATIIQKLAVQVNTLSSTSESNPRVKAAVVIDLNMGNGDMMEAFLRIVMLHSVRRIHFD